RTRWAFASDITDNRNEVGARSSSPNHLHPGNFARSSLTTCSCGISSSSSSSVASISAHCSSVRMLPSFSLSIKKPISTATASCRSGGSLRMRSMTRSSLLMLVEPAACRCGAVDIQQHDIAVAVGEAEAEHFAHELADLLRFEVHDGGDAAA